jgi:hypothetical protein
MRYRWILLGLTGAFGASGCTTPPRQPVPTITSSQLAAMMNVQLNEVPMSIPQEIRATEFRSSAPSTVIQKTSSPSKSEEPEIEPSDDPLAGFTGALKRGDKLVAASYLEAYVRQHPDQAMYRLQLAELLIQTKNDAKARAHFEQFVANAQTGPETIRKYLVHAHTRLMEIAQRKNDSFGELLHRGIGLLILVQEQDNNPERDDEFCEEMLCKSYRALIEAKELKPGDQRVRVYLAEVYERMGNRRASMNERGAARNGVVPGELTMREQSLVFMRGF